MNNIKLFEAKLTVCVTGEIAGDYRTSEIDDNLETFAHVWTEARVNKTVWERDINIKIRWLSGELSLSKNGNSPSKRFQEEAVEEYLRGTGVGYTRFTLGKLSEVEVVVDEFNQETLFSIEVDSSPF